MKREYEDARRRGEEWCYGCVELNNPKNRNTDARSRYQVILDLIKEKEQNGEDVCLTVGMVHERTRERYGPSQADQVFNDIKERWDRGSTWQYYYLSTEPVPANKCCPLFSEGCRRGRIEREPQLAFHPARRAFLRELFDEARAKGCPCALGGIHGRTSDVRKP